MSLSQFINNDKHIVLEWYSLDPTPPDPNCQYTLLNELTLSKETGKVRYTVYGPLGTSIRSCVEGKLNNINL
jgi:hypothetical protein